MELTPWTQADIDRALAWTKAEGWTPSRAQLEGSANLPVILKALGPEAGKI